MRLPGVPTAVSSQQFWSYCCGETWPQQPQLMLCPTLWDWDKKAPCHLWNQKCCCFLCSAFRVQNHGFGRPSLGLSCCYSMSDSWSPITRLWYCSCCSLSHPLSPKSCTDLPSMGYIATALCHTPWVLNHSFGLASWRPSCCCSAPCCQSQDSDPPSPGHAVTASLTQVLRHWCILSSHSLRHCCISPSWGPNPQDDPQRRRPGSSGDLHTCAHQTLGLLL